MLITNITEAIGNTPLLKMPYEKGFADIYIKLESLNPFGSVKDRIAMGMIQDAKETGRLKKGQRIVEPTSGNTGVALAAVGAALDHPVTIVMPESMSIERRQLIQAYGAELILTPASGGMKQAITIAEDIKRTEDAYMSMQFQNESNPNTHFAYTASELEWDFDMYDFKPDAFVAGVGTGGTITGVGEHLKRLYPNMQVVAVEAKESPVLSGGEPGPHKIQGISAGFVPDVLNMEIIDEIIQIDSNVAIQSAQELAIRGLLVGISSGASFAGAVQKAKELGEGHHVVTIAHDTGTRYMSTDLFKDIV